MTNPSGTGPTVALELFGPSSDRYNLASLGSLTFASSTGGQLVLANVIVGGDVGYINAHGIAQLEINGDLTEGIDTHVIDGVATNVVSLEIHGDMLGPVTFPFNTAAPSHLYSLIVDGDIGSYDDNFTLYIPMAGTIQCDNLIADLNVYADMRRLETTGALIGDIYASYLIASTDAGGTGDSGIYIGSGNLKSTIWIDDSFSEDIELPADVGPGGLLRLPSLPSGHSVLIGGTIQDDGGLLLVDGEMAGTVTINGSAGLQGQIIVNGGNASDPNHELWSGDVETGSVTLGPSESQPYLAPYYEAAESTLGGGAIGLVPFNFHPKDSDPVHGSALVNGAPTSVDIYHYGPVADGDGDLTSTPPVRVFEASLMLPWGHDPHKDSPICDSIWTEVTSGFSYSITDRVVHITNNSHSFGTNRVYEVIPADLVCDYVTPSPDVVYVSDWVGTEGCSGEADTDGYGFKVASGFDLNENMAVESGDMSAWAADPVDFNDDGATNAIDVGMLADAIASGGE